MGEIATGERRSSTASSRADNSSLLQQTHQMLFRYAGMRSKETWARLLQRLITDEIFLTSAYISLATHTRLHKLFCIRLARMACLHGCQNVHLPKQSASNETHPTTSKCRKAGVVAVNAFNVVAVNDGACRGVEGDRAALEQLALQAVPSPQAAVWLRAKPQSTRAHAANEGKQQTACDCLNTSTIP